MAYKISYNVFNDKVENYAKDEIGLAAEILDMERDVGKICYNVIIEECDIPHDYVLTNTKTNLMNIQRWAKILEQDWDRELKARKK